MKRTIVIAALVGGAIAIVLIGWYRAGVREVDGQIAAQVTAIEREGHDREAALADDLVARLEELRVSESARPYLHYQNLFHDPAGGSEGLSVTPSPLATGPADRLVALHFQIDEHGALTSPSINDEVPETVQLAAPDRAALAAVGAVKDELARTAARGAVQVATPTQVAMATPRRRKNPDNLPAVQEPAVQTIELPPEAYQQNQMTNQIFAQTRLGGPRAQVQQQQAPELPPAQAPTPPVTPPRVRPSKPTPAPPPPVIITVAPLTWTATQIAGQPALVAVRQVVTPDGARTQGLVVRADALTGWLHDRDVTDAALTTAAGTPLGLGGSRWAIHVDTADSIAYARTSSALLRDGFLMKFVPVAVLAIVCGLLVVGVTARSERLAQERARFAAAAAHELRTPLAGIQLYGDMLADELGDPAKHRDYARRVAVEAARLGRVVTNVMGVSQLERGSLTVRPEPSDAVAVVKDVIERVEPGVVRAGAAIELVAPATLTARLDRDAVTRVLTNVIDNAEKYGRGADDRTITVTVAAVDDAVEIAVRDRGPGLPAALRRGRFRAFTRAAGDDAPPGLGLGLALSSALATAMGGTLAPRTVSPGAELVLRLPTA